VEGVDRVFETTGDFVSAVFRVMPHASEPELSARIREEMKSVRLQTLSQYLGGEPKPIDDVHFPPVGATDFDVFGNDLLEVMQFVFDHTTFDPENDLDRGVLAVYEPMGVVPGREFDPARVAKIDGARFRRIAEAVASQELARASDPGFEEEGMSGLFLPKGQMTLDRLVFQSIIGPIGLPAAEAVYPFIGTADGKPMNALHDYVVRMSREELPPARAFWSLTLYDSKNGFFIPNERKKYSVGENAGMKLDDEGGIEIHVAASRPEGVPDENWLPIERRDEAIDLVMRIYVPDPEEMKTWQAPKAEVYPGG